MALNGGYVAKSKNAKREAEKLHAARRALQRFGITVNLHDLVRKIQNQEAHFVSRQSLRVSLWRIEIEGKEVVMAYDRKRKMIITFLYTEEELTRIIQSGSMIGGAP